MKKKLMKNMILYYHEILKKNKCTSCIWNSKASENKIVCFFPKCIYSSPK